MGTTDQIVRLLGAFVAAVSSLVLFCSLFVSWAPSQLACLEGDCAFQSSSGWEFLAGEDLVIAATVAGAIGLLSLWRLGGGLARSRTGAIVAAAGLLSAAAISPHALDSVLGPAGPLVALGAALLVAGGGLLAALGDRFFERVPRDWTSVAIALAPAVFVATMFLPWLEPRSPRPGPGDPFTPSPVLGELTAWDFRVMPALLVLCAAAVAIAAAGAVVLRWRAAYAVGALAGFLTAAIAAAGVSRVASELGTEAAWGAYVAAAVGAALIGACLAAAVKPADG